MANTKAYRHCFLLNFMKVRTNGNRYVVIPLHSSHSRKNISIFFENYLEKLLLRPFRNKQTKKEKEMLYFLVFLLYTALFFENA